MRSRRSRVSWRRATPIAEAEASQDEPRYVKGERVRHKLFGDGSIAELSGVGREVKAVIDFDDESVGRKTIKLAYTTEMQRNPKNLSSSIGGPC